MSDDHHSMLCAFLKGLLGVSHLAEEIQENLKKNAITIRQFRLLNEADLVELGFRMGERRVVLDYIHNTNTAATATPVSEEPTPAISSAEPTPAPSPSSSAEHSGRQVTHRPESNSSFKNLAIDELLTRRPQGQGQVNGSALAAKLHDGKVPEQHERKHLVQTVGRYLMNNCAVINKPSPAEKQDICAAIISTFPILRDNSLTGYDCFFDRQSYTGWLEWYCRGRRANCADIETQWHNSRTKNSQQPSEDTHLLERQMAEQRPNVSNRQELLNLMAATRAVRRKWVTKERPTITEIVRRYPRFMDINETISEEFSAINPKSIRLMDKWQSYKARVLQLAATKPAVQHLLADLDDMDEDKKTMVAFECLIHLLRAPPRKGVKVPRLAPEVIVKQFFQDMEDDTVDSAVSRLTAAGVVQPILFRTQENYYIKIDNSAILIVDCSCFAEAVEFLFHSFFVFHVEYPTDLSKFYHFLERLLNVPGSSKKLFEFFRTLDSF